MTLDSKLKGKSGIYQIRNLINGKVYVGRTNCFYTRFCHHRANLKKENGREVNEYILRSFLKYGVENFVFEVLEFAKENLVEKEHKWIVNKKSMNRRYGYNLRNEKDGTIRHHPSTLEKLKTSRLNFYKDQANRKKLSKIIKDSCWNPQSKAKRIKEGRSKSYSNKAKYEYFINDEGPYRCYQIKFSPYRAGLARMWAKKTDVVFIKGVKIERVQK
jgi:group I intron endonuclease